MLTSGCPCDQALLVACEPYPAARRTQQITADLLVNTPSRAVLYAIQMPAALIFMLIARGAARVRRESPRLILLWASAGALAFDGLALGFWPSLYGQEGVAQSILAASAVGLRVEWLLRCSWPPMPPLPHPEPLPGGAAINIAGGQCFAFSDNMIDTPQQDRLTVTP